jgi:membrane protein CcdC involved in cytochrome C biogenesis
MSQDNLVSLVTRYEVGDCGLMLGRSRAFLFTIISRLALRLALPSVQLVLHSRAKDKIV